MKKTKLITILLLGFFGGLYSQTNISLSFTGSVNGLYQQIDSICIENVTRGGDTVLQSPDSLLLLSHNIGISGPGSHYSAGFILHPPYPNPFASHTIIRLSLFCEEQVVIRVFDQGGRLHQESVRHLPAGEHQFVFNSGKEKYYLVSVETTSHRRLLKLISLSPTSGKCKLDYYGSTGAPWFLRKERSTFYWEPGDTLRFIGFATSSANNVLADTIVDAPLQSVVYTFQYHLPPPPVADFTAGNTAVYAGDTIHFTDLSTGNPTSWHWDFGDGNVSIQQNPIHDYTLSGVFDVRLIVGNSGGYDTLVKAGYIQVVCAPGPYPVYDIDCNGYDTVHIGNQVWLKQNLRTTRYNDGTPIPNITSGTSWITLNTGARCYYSNDSAAYSALYGALYNWDAASHAQLCPVGWHVPGHAEWDTLANYLGGMAVAGGQLKDTGTVHWLPPNTGATNSSGFTALPGGSRIPGSGWFENMGYKGGWWSSSEISGLPTDAWSWVLAFNNANIVYSFDHKRRGYSVRCLQD